VTESTVLIGADEERELIEAVLQRHGASEQPASVQSDWLVEADLRGQSSHGIARLPMLVARMKAGLVAPNSTPQMNWATDSVLAVEGARGFGPVVAQQALEMATERAKSMGVVLVAISNTNHLGILAPYVEGVAAKGLTCIALTTSEALVHPWGGKTAMVGTNPLAIGVPADPSPLVLDMATGQVSRGKIIHYSQLGMELQPGWAVDSDGEPTTDPEAALDGSISPFGGAKGYALGLALEVLVGSLTNSAFGRDVHGTLDADHECNKGDVFICIDQNAATGESRRVEVSRYLDAVRAAPTATGSTGVRIPGERAQRERARRASSGVEVALGSWEAALALAESDSAIPVNLTPSDRREEVESAIERETS